MKHKPKELYLKERKEKENEDCFYTDFYVYLSGNCEWNDFTKTLVMQLVEPVPKNK